MIDIALPSPLPLQIQSNAVTAKRGNSGTGQNMYGTGDEKHIVMH
jgi:hypothetical protein